MLKKIQKYYGLYRGPVIDNNDPAKSGRVKVKVWGVYDGVSEQDLPWCLPCFPFGSSPSHGSVFVPVKGDTVYLMFEAGNPNSPIYIGSSPMKGGIVSDCDKNDKYMVIKTKGGSKIYVSDAEDEGIKLESSKGQTIQLDDVAGRIRLADKSGSYIEMADGNITINPKQKLNLKLGAAAVSGGAMGAMSSISSISSVTAGLGAVAGNLTAINSIANAVNSAANSSIAKTAMKNFQKGMSQVQGLTKNLNVGKLTSVVKDLGIKSVAGLQKIGDTLSKIKNVALDKVKGLTSKLKIDSLGGLSKLSSMAKGLDFSKITSVAAGAGIVTVSELLTKGDILNFDAGKLAALASEFKLDNISELKDMVGMDFSAVDNMVGGLQDAGVSDLGKGLEGLEYAKEIGADKIKGIGDGLELGGITDIGQGMDVVNGKLDGMDVAGIDVNDPEGSISKMTSDQNKKLGEITKQMPDRNVDNIKEELPVEAEKITEGGKEYDDWWASRQDLSAFNLSRG